MVGLAASWADFPCVDQFRDATGLMKKKNLTGGFGEMKRDTASPTSVKAGQLSKEAEITYGKLIEESSICWRQGATQEVISLLRKALVVKPNSLQALINLGIALQAQGDLQAAIDAYRQALA
ncbi:MAG: tetratricopeptide repeat protein, partial [Synechococcus sp. SB0676_bin_10]|nr:tetratricopeptide repeat protein [Synechococcus sp. SB0676_bin_10]